MTLRRFLPLAALLALLGAPAPAQADAAPSREQLIRQFELKPVGTVPVEQATGQVREFTLEVHRIQAEIAPGVKVEQWAYGFPGQTPTVPGPELRVTQGDLVRVTLVNTFDQPHTIHLHGIVSLAERMDGLTEVLPGETYTYEFVATDAGTFAYHCHFQTNLHLDMGMYGALIVEPRDPDKRVWQDEHTLILDEWDSHQDTDPAHAVHKPTPNYFLVNGKASPLIPDVDVKPGQVTLLRFINLGYEVHSLHLHGMTFLEVAKDGHDLPVPIEADTLLIAPGERYDLLVKGRDGDFVMHDHIGAHATNDGVYPGGIHFMVHGGSPLDEHGKPDPTAATLGHDHMGGMPMGAAPDVHSQPLLTDADTPTVRIAGFKFTPPLLRVKAGTTVTWQNADFASHGLNLRAPDGTEVSRPLTRGSRASLKLDQPGVYTYHCLPHPFMTGTIVVE